MNETSGLIFDSHGLRRYRAITSSYASRPMEIDVYANGDVYVRGRATNKQLAELIERILKDQK